MREALYRRAGHEECLQNPVIHGMDGPGGHAFVIVAIPAVEIDSIDLPFRGIESDREKIWKDRRVDALGEGLAFVLVLLPMALNAVSEDFVEEHARGAAGKDGRSDERIHDRRLQ